MTLAQLQSMHTALEACLTDVAGQPDGGAQGVVRLLRDLIGDALKLINTSIAELGG